MYVCLYVQSGFDVIYLGSSSDDALQSQKEVVDSSLSSLPIFSSSVEALGVHSIM